MYDNFTLPPKKTLWQKIISQLYTIFTYVYVLVINKITKNRYPREPGTLWSIRQMKLLLKDQSIQELLAKSSKNDLPNDLRQKLVKYQK